jgi:hypothetical protein
MNFKTSQELREILNYFSANNLTESELKFACYADNMFIYHLEINQDLFYEFVFKCDTELFAEMSFEDIINADEMEYFSVVFYNDDPFPLKVGEWNILDNKHLN